MFNAGGNDAGSSTLYPFPTSVASADLQSLWVKRAKQVVARQSRSYSTAVMSGAARIWRAEAAFAELASLPYDRNKIPQNEELREPGGLVTESLLSLYPVIGPLANGLVGIPLNELMWKHHHEPKGLASSHFSTPPEFEPPSAYWKVGDAGLPDEAASSVIEAEFVADAPNPSKARIFVRLLKDIGSMPNVEVTMLLSPVEWNQIYLVFAKKSVRLEAMFLQEIVSRMVSYSTDKLQRELGGITHSNSEIQRKAAVAFGMSVPSNPGQFKAATPYVAGDPRMSGLNPTIYSAVAFQSSVDVSGHTVSNWGVLPPRTTAVAL